MLQPMVSAAGLAASGKLEPRSPQPTNSARGRCNGDTMVQPATERHGIRLVRHIVISSVFPGSLSLALRLAGRAPSEGDSTLASEEPRCPSEGI